MSLSWSLTFSTLWTETETLFSDVPGIIGCFGSDALLQATKPGSSAEVTSALGVQCGGFTTGNSVNKELRDLTGQPAASCLAAARRIRWYGHVLRLPPWHPTRALLDFAPEQAGWRRPTGRGGCPGFTYQGAEIPGGNEGATTCPGIGCYFSDNNNIPVNSYEVEHTTLARQNCLSYITVPPYVAIMVTSLGTWRTLNLSIDLGWVTDAKYTSLEIVNTKQTYHVGDILVLEVIARDGNKRRKMYGGDYFRAVLRDKSQTASTTGTVRDHGNGLYTISFLLSFPGKVTPEVQLIHPSEAVQFLREFREDVVDKLMTQEEQQLFERPFWNTPLAPDINNTIVVSDVDENATVTQSLPLCRPGVPHRQPVGYWLQDTWHSLSCKVGQFRPPDITKCLTNRSVHFRGDSTIRQWVERLIKWNIVEKGPGNGLIGPYACSNHSTGTIVTFNFHTVPIQTVSWFPLNLGEAGISTEVRSMVGGPNVVIILSLCSHFTAEPKRVYTSRMYDIRSAIQELHKKYPETTVIVKTCNTRNHRHYRELVQMSDWISVQINQEMRSIMEDLNIAILDVWDMTVSQRYRHDIHPNQRVQDNELDILMSHICPDMVKKG
ncbi:Neurexophilin [Branchiostoma belcheri]|nr:Neurexophilin [Branchiostoma belcheri]